MSKEFVHSVQLLLYSAPLHPRTLGCLSNVYYYYPEYAELDTNISGFVIIKNNNAWITRWRV